MGLEKDESMTTDRQMERHRVLRKAFEETLDLVGERFKRTIIVDLECAGLYCLDMAYLDLGEINQGLTRLFGAEATELIMEQVIIKMDELEALNQINGLKKHQPF